MTTAEERPAPEDASIMRLEHVDVRYKMRGGATVHAVTDVTLDVARQETLGVVGETGSGKSSLARAMIQFPRPSSGRVWFDGVELTSLDGEELRRQRPGLQMILQDPIGSLNPRRRIADVVAEPLDIWAPGSRAERRARVAAALDEVGLDADGIGDRRAHQLSGGQCQRVSIARALVLRPKMLICDEPVSALDVSVQAQILNLLEDAKAHYALTLVFISHDLGVIRVVCDRVAVMYLGKLCEIAPTQRLFSAPAHPYTAELLAAVPDPDSDRRSSLPAVESTERPSVLAPPSGCPFRTRCPRATERCVAEEPLLRSIATGQHVACHFPLQQEASGRHEQDTATARQNGW